MKQKTFTFWFQYHTGLPFAVTVDHINKEKATEKAWHELVMAYGSELASQHKLLAR